MIKKPKVGYVKDGTAYIPLTNSKTWAKTDEEFFEEVNMFQWYMDKEGYCKTKINGHAWEMGKFVLYLNSRKFN